MSNSSLTESEILQIRSMVESMSGKLDLLLGANAQVREHVYGMFRKRPGLARIYLLLDDEEDRSQTSTIEYVASSLGTSKPNVIQQVRPLRLAGIITAIDLPNGKVLLKKNSCERVFGISRILKKEFGLNEPGKRTSQPGAQPSDTEPLPE